ncbi:MAG: GGDEF domain-containing protein [Burkholderiales bacterium]|nr:GGDEF domain-containing protein [Burkholderiales bacterium]MCE7875749.1 GGDEF domain-containing protein [Betaproteobacteria bacterium PRO3]
MSSVRDLTRPADLARATLKELLARRLQATPDNYARVYLEIAAPHQRAAAIAASPMLAELADDLQRVRGEGDIDARAFRQAVSTGDWPQAKLALKRLTAPAPQFERGDAPWAPLIRELLHEWDSVTPTVTRARKRESLDHVLTAFATSQETLAARLRGLVRSWAADGTATGPAPTFAGEPAGEAGGEAAAVLEGKAVALAPPPLDGAVAESLREALAELLAPGIAERRVFCAEILGEAAMLAGEVRALADGEGVESLRTRSRHLSVLLERFGDDAIAIQGGLLRILNLVLVNTAELVGDDAWLQGQLTALATLAAGPVDHRTIDVLEGALRDIVLKQGMLKKSIDDAKGALKTMVTTFIDRVGTIVEDTSHYHDRLAGYSQRIAKADSLPQLSDLVVSLMDDTRGVQTDLQRTHSELVEARGRVDAFGAEVRRLETELATVSERLHEDQLTELLNRRGLARAFHVEAARADRQNTPMCLALMDIDHFKKINDQYGHPAGDQVLVHLTRIVRESIRPTDVVARFGGEEFVILLPEAPLDEAAAVVQRVQRELTKRIFMHEHQRVLITFSAGVVQRMPGELRDALIARADRALYAAKQAGRNRVVTE